ncbi:MAG: SiaB family protein kinase [Cytophagales bacterium]
MNPTENERHTIYKNYIVNKGNALVLSYKGPFLEEILHKLSDIIRDTFTQDPVLSRKLLAVFIEFAQNVYYYSAETIVIGEKEYGIGSVSVSRYEGSFKFTTGNMVPNAHIDELIESCELINSLDRDELRKLKRDTRTAGPGARSKGAGIGLIQVALTAGEPIEYEAIAHDEENSFFSLTAKIKN